MQGPAEQPKLRNGRNRIVLGMNIHRSKHADHLKYEATITLILYESFRSNASNPKKGLPEARFSGNRKELARIVSFRHEQE